MRWTAEQLPALTGRRILITGATSGTGLAAAEALARRGAEVIMAVRSVENGRREAARIAALPGAGPVSVERLDLAEFASVRALAHRLTGRIDILINNAGVMTPPRYRATPDGYELQFQTNHLSHFALTGLLLPRLAESDAPRVATMSSIAHFRGDAATVEPTPSDGYEPSLAYGRSKLANLLFALELQRRASAAGSPLVSTAAHPGVTRTNLFTSSDGLGALPLIRAVGPIMMRALLPGPEQGAESLLYAATLADPGSYTGPTRLFETRGAIGPAKLSSRAVDPALADGLWRRSEELTGVAFDLG